MHANHPMILPMQITTWNESLSSFIIIQILWTCKLPICITRSFGTWHMVYKMKNNISNETPSVGGHICMWYSVEKTWRRRDKILIDWYKNCIYVIFLNIPSYISEYKQTKKTNNEAIATVSVNIACIQYPFIDQ
jgi:hypothetical protein